MRNLESFFDQLSVMHDHLCPKQVLGIRFGMYAAEWLDLNLPQTDKRLFAFVETDGCFTDGVAAATGCWVGHRTMRVMDYGKVAATFVDTQTDRAVRIRPHPKSRVRALEFAPDAVDRWHAQLAAYQIMPSEVLLVAQEVTLNVSLTAIISQHGHRVVCDSCGEDIINEREVSRGGQTLCRTCAEGPYFSVREKTPLAIEFKRRVAVQSMLATSL